MLLRAPKTAPVEWIVSTLLRDQLGLGVDIVESNDASYSLELEGRKLLLPDIFLSQATIDWLSPSTLPTRPLEHWDVEKAELEAALVNRELPILFGSPGFTLDAAGNGYLELDVFGSGFFMLSRYEEAVITDRDDHGRFPARASIAHKEGFLNRPIIDEYTEVLWAAMKRVWPGLGRKRSQASMTVSHDADTPSQYSFQPPGRMLRTAAGDLLKRRDLSAAIHGPWLWLNSRHAIHPADPYNTFDWIMEVSERHQLTSAFYFICGHTEPSLDGDYDIESRPMRSLLRHIHERGHEIGLHPSYNSYRDSSVISAEATRLRRVCSQEAIKQTEWGGRMHYLRWETPETLYALEEAGMAYDNTLSYADAPGFRCGTCREFRAFDPVKRRTFSLRIRPLIAMEGTIMGENYMGLGVTEAAYHEFVNLKAACEVVRGNFSLLWHNTQLVTPQQKMLYESLLSA